jgi:RNA polymerase sigma-70 factor (ECF subfamily)
MTSVHDADRPHNRLESESLAAAIAGNRVALERLLLAHYDDLARRIGTKLPARLRSTQAVEDILQLTFFHAFRDIGRFEPRPGATFRDWLHRIADNRLYDAIKQHDRKRHGGDLHRIQEGERADGSVRSLWECIAGGDCSPASVAAQSEALQALQVALAGLSAEQRTAIQMHLLEGKSLAETAAALGRTPDAVRGLVHRGKQALHDSMGRASLWLKSK